MTWYYEIKEYYDYAEDIEGVNIHYLWTPRDGVPDWDNQRVTRFMPRVEPSLPSDSDGQIEVTEGPSPTMSRLRRKILKLPKEILDPQTHTLTDRYLLHHYFEVFQDGHRHYSPLYTEEIHTGAAMPVATAESGNESLSTGVSSFTPATVKESKR